MTSPTDDALPPLAPSAAITPTDVSPVEPPVPGAALAAMRARFLADFADGRIGEHHNSYQHRSRILRQLGDRGSDG